MLSLLRQCIYGLTAGYEDLNNHDQLRSDPLLSLKIAPEKLRICCFIILLKSGMTGISILFFMGIPQDLPLFIRQIAITVRGTAFNSALSCLRRRIHSQIRDYIGNNHGLTGNMGIFLVVLHVIYRLSDIINDIEFLFTDGHGFKKVTRWFDDLAYLDELDWKMIPVRVWRPTEEDPDRMRRKQSEFWVKREISIEKMLGIAAYNEQSRNEVTRILSKTGVSKPVKIKKEYYY